MSITIDKISQNLNWEAIINNPESTNINKISLFKKGIKAFDSNTLYIINLVDLNLIPIGNSNNINLLCVDFCLNENLAEANLNKLSRFNLLYPPQLLSLKEAEDKVQKSIDEEDYLIYSSLKLYEALTTEKGLQHITDVALTLFDNPIIVADNTFNVLAHSENEGVKDEICLQIINNGYYPEEYVKKVVKVKTIYNKIYCSEDTVIISDDYINVRYLSKKIEVNGKSVGFISILEDFRKFTDNDIKLFNVLCKAITSEMRNGSYIKQIRDHKYENFIIELINGTIRKELIENYLRQLELRFKSNFFILNVQFLDDINDQSIFYIEYLTETLAKIVSNGKCVAFNNSLVVLISQESKDLIDEKFVSTISAFLEEKNLVAGISHCFNNLENTSRFYNQATEAIRIGKRLDKNKRIYDYVFYSCYHLLDEIDKIENLMDFCNPKLIEIIEYDRLYHSNNALTIYAYLTSGLDFVLAAQKLDIHRNSVKYRINKIEELFNIDFNDTNIVFSFALSFRILIYTEKLSFDHLKSIEPFKGI